MWIKFLSASHFSISKTIKISLKPGHFNAKTYLILYNLERDSTTEFMLMQVKSELEIKLANILYAQGNYERVVEILDKASSSYSPDLRVILLKTFAQLGKIFLLLF